MLSAPKVLNVIGWRDHLEISSQVEPDQQRIALIAGWSPSSRVSRSAGELIASLQSLNYAVVYCTTCPDPQPLDFSLAKRSVDLDGLNVIRRPNLGYDFGSWAVAMSYFREYLCADNVLVANDSLLGPFDSIAPLIEHFEHSTADVWGATESLQFGAHLQSFFRGFRFGVLRERPMEKFWRNIRVQSTKDEVIRQYEYGFTDFLSKHSYSCEAFVPASRISRTPLNPTIFGWRELLDQRFPFLKKQLVRWPNLVPDGSLIAGEIYRRFGENLKDW